MGAAFCVQCGAGMGPADRFCGRCGAPLVPISPSSSAPPPLPPEALQSSNSVSHQIFPPAPSAATPPTPATMPAAERVIGVIPQVVEVKGFMGMKTTFMNLVVTDRRLIFAVQSDAMWDIMDAEEKKMELEFEHRGGAWRQYLASHDFGSAPWRVYETMDPESIAREHPDNRTIPLGQLSLVVLVLNKDPDCRGDDLKITSAGQEQDFGLTWENGEEAQRVLSRVVPVQVSWSE